MKRFFPGLKRFIRGLAIGIGALLVLLLVAHTIAIWVTGRALERELAARRELGLANTIEELAGPPIPDGQNAAWYMQRGATWAQAIGQDLNDVVLEHDFSHDRLSPEHRQRVADLEVAFERMLVPLRQAAELNEYRSLLLATREERLDALEELLESHRTTRLIVWLLHLRALQQLEDDRPGDAFDTVLVMYAVGRHQMHDPTMTSYLVGAAVKMTASPILLRMLAEGSLDDEQRRRLDEELARHDRIEPLRGALQSEIVVGFPAFVDVFGYFPRPLVNFWKTQYLRYLTAVDQALTTSARDQQPLSIATSMPPLGFPVSLMQPAVEAMLEAANRDIANTRCLRVLIALQSYLAEHPDPANATPSLDDLGLDADVTRDPFTDEPLRLRRTDDGWLVYSIGADGEDQGGDFEKAKDVGFLLPAAWATPVEEDAASGPQTDE